MRCMGLGLSSRRQELGTLLRCSALAAGIPWLFAYARRDAVAVNAAFDEVVVPLVDNLVGGQDRRRRLIARLRPTAVQVGLPLWGYASMTRTVFDPRLAALAGTFMRLYDDYFDHDADRNGTGERLALLLAGKPFDPVTEHEALLKELFVGIVRQLARSPDDPIFTVVNDMHDIQCRSRWQRTLAEIDSRLLADITVAKGGQAGLLLCGLIRPVPANEESLARDIGVVYQLLDDQADILDDRRRAIVTPATRGETSIADVGRLMRTVARNLRRSYGRARARRLTGLFFVLFMGVLSRRWGVGVRTTKRVSTWRLLIEPVPFAE